MEEYSIFVARIRKYQGQGYAIEQAIDRAVDDCIQEGILAELLRSEREELLGTLGELLLKESRMEDLKRMMKDKVYRDKLYEEYGLKRK